MHPKLIIVFFIYVLAFSSCTEPSKVDENKVTTTFSEGKSKSVFKVWGNCEMCKENIESALKLKGIDACDWNSETKFIEVTYDTLQISLNQIQKAIALVGYDNVAYKGSDSAYQKLEECCQYDRK